MKEEQLISKAKRNDRKAQRMLFAQYKSYWYSICLRYGRNQHDAMDMLQNGLINIYTKISQFNSDRGNFKSWSGRIIVNDCLMYLRKNSFISEDLNNHHSVFDKSETSLDILAAEELTKLIQKLPDGYRAVFNLYVLEGYQHREIAEKLKISEGTSKSQLFKAKKLLREKLEILYQLESSTDE